MLASEKNVNVTIIGAGGFMGQRVSDNLLKRDYNLFFCEKSPQGIAKIEDKGQKVTDIETAVPRSDFVILAVPDKILSIISADVVPLMKKGAGLILLDPAAAYAKEVTLREDCSFIVVHPCHVSFLTEFETMEEVADRFGGVAAKQDIVISLFKGEEKVYKVAEEISKQMFAPIGKAYKVTVEQMAMLEPALVEVVVATLIVMMKESAEEVVKAGVPEEATYSFLLGHINEILQSVFEADTFSDACRRAVEYGRERIIKEDWKKVFDWKSIDEVVDKMLHPGKAEAVK